MTIENNLEHEEILTFSNQTFKCLSSTLADAILTTDKAKYKE